MRTLTTEELIARATALNSAAKYLESTWTDNPTEHAQGLVVAGRLQQGASRLRSDAQKKELAAKRRRIERLGTTQDYDN